MTKPNNQSSTLLKTPWFNLEIPDNYMSRYVTPSEGERIIAGAMHIKGSCVQYNQLVEYDHKEKKLAAICADGAKKFNKEKGLCQYLFPFKEELGIKVCDNDLKPHWHFPFTGNGFIPTRDGSFALLHYLTRELVPDEGHFLIFFEDDGQIEKIYRFTTESQAWIDVKQEQAQGSENVLELEKDDWNQLTAKGSASGDKKSEIAVWRILFQLPYWYTINRSVLDDGGVVPYLGNNDGTPTLLAFTSENLAKEYIAKVDMKKGEFTEAVKRYAIPQDFSALLKLNSHGVQDILINSGVTDRGLNGRLHELPDMYAWILKHDLTLEIPPDQEEGHQPEGGTQAKEPDTSDFHQEENKVDESIPAPLNGGKMNVLHRIRLLYRKPNEAFYRMTPSEAKRDAIVIFFLYFFVTAPVLVHKLVFQGRLHGFDRPETWSVIGAGLFIGILLTACISLLGAAVLHLFLNVISKSGRHFKDALVLLVLSLAPQLALILCYPVLFLYWGEYTAYLVFLMARVLLTIGSIRVFYWGLRTWFNLPSMRALMFACLPVVAVVLIALR